MKKFKLLPSQKNDVKRIVKHPTKGALNASITGAGKTAVGIGVVKALQPKVVLIIAPLNTEDGWHKAVQQQFGPQAGIRVLGNHTPRQIHHTRQIDAGVSGIYFVGWEWMATRADYSDWPVDLVIFDEIHRACTRDTRSAKMAYNIGKAVAKRGGHRLGLSATPNGNAMSGFWAVAHALWPTQDFDWHFNSYWRWAKRHLTMDEVYTGGEEPITVAGRELVPGSVVKELPLYIRHEERTRCCRFHPKGIQADLPKRVVHRVGVELSPVQRRLYNELEKDGIAYLKEHDLPIESEWPMVLNLRMHQVCLAVPTTEQATRWKSEWKRDWRTGVEELVRTEQAYVKVSYPLNAKSTKIDAMMDVLADIPTDEKVIVFTHSQGVIAAVVDRINAKYKGAAASWDGTLKKKDRPALKDAFIRRGLRILVCQIVTMAEGVDGLQDVCHNEIWLSRLTDGKMNKQAGGRLQRRGQKHTVQSWRIYAMGTRDEEQMLKLEDNDRYLKKALRAGK